jgi:ABC-type polysaccharide/polyol phosphate export permease
MNLLFYSTPIVYQINQVPESKFGIPLRAIINANPLTKFVGLSRDAFYTLNWPSLISLIGVIFFSLVTFVLGWLIFIRKARNVTEEL